VAALVVGPHQREHAERTGGTRERNKQSRTTVLPDVGDNRDTATKRVAGWERIVDVIRVRRFDQFCPFVRSRVNRDESKSVAVVEVDAGAVAEVRQQKPSDFVKALGDVELDRQQLSDARQEVEASRCPARLVRQPYAFEYLRDAPTELEHD
jgi:hypothetical protein